MTIGINRHFTDQIDSNHPHTALTRLQKVDATHEMHQRTTDHHSHTAKAADQLQQATEKLQNGEVTRENIRQQTQAALVVHLFGSEDQQVQAEKALQLTYHQAVDKLNEVLTPELGENAINAEKLAAQGGLDYWSPENTAQRIVSGATAFFTAYQGNHPGDDFEQQLDDFMTLIRDGIHAGFEDAKGILGELNVFDGSIADTYQSTLDLVNHKLDAFKQTLQEQQNPVLNPTTDTTSSTVQHTDDGGVPTTTRLDINV